MEKNNFLRTRDGKQLTTRIPNAWEELPRLVYGGEITLFKVFYKVNK